MTPRPRTPPERIDAGVIVLRRHRVDDADRLADAVGESLEHLRPWMAWANDDAVRPEFQRQRIRDDSGWDEGSAYNYLILTPDEQEVIGGCGLMRRVGEGAIEIGYWIHAAHGHRGLATAAARALTDAAMALPDVDRVEIHCDEANVRSAAIPRKLGYRLDRIEEDGIEAPGETGRSLIWVLEAR